LDENNFLLLLFFNPRPRLTKNPSRKGSDILVTLSKKDEERNFQSKVRMIEGIVTVTERKYLL